MQLSTFFEHVLARKATEDEIIAFKNGFAGFEEQLWEKFPKLRGHKTIASVERTSQYSMWPKKTWLDIGWGDKGGAPPPYLPRAAAYAFRNQNSELVRVKLVHKSYADVKRVYQSSFMGGGFLS